MTVIEKKQLLMAKIDTFSEDQLDKALELLKNLEAKEQDRQAKIDAIVKRDFERYHEVFKALA